MSRRHTGRTDVGLNELGRKQARSIGRLLSGVPFDRVLTSPMRRARETCLLSGLGEQAEEVDDLREWDYGDYEGATTGAIQSGRPGWELFRDGCPNGEVVSDVASRADRVIAGLRGRETRAVVFAHGHLLRVLAARWAELRPEDGRHLVLDAGRLSVLGYERDTPAIGAWNLAPDGAFPG